MRLAEFIQNNIQPAVSTISTNPPADGIDEAMSASSRRELDALIQELNQTGNVARKLDVIAKMLVTIGG